MTKLTLIGAGSFVFGPAVLIQSLAEHRLEGVHLALVDVDRDAAERMAAVGRRIAQDEGVPCTITAHTDRREALPGSVYVLCSAAPNMHQAFQTDSRIAEEHLPGHVVTEFGGIAGISYSLRQAHFIEQLCRDMRELCPEAMLLDVANPLPRVCQVASSTGVPTVGFCCAAIEGIASLWHRATGRTSHFPFKEVSEDWLFTAGGLNHFVWLVECRHRSDGRDVLPELLEMVQQSPVPSNELCDSLFKRIGMPPLPADNHTADFLMPTPRTASRRRSSHGDADERKRRIEALDDVATGRRPWRQVLTHLAWERPIDLVVALGGGETAAFHALNLPNTGQLVDLPPDVFVETPARVDDMGIHPTTIKLPDAALPYAKRTALVTDTIVQAALQRRRHLVHLAVELDPTILDKHAGYRAIDACMQAHADLLPSYD